MQKKFSKVLLPITTNNLPDLLVFKAKHFLPIADIASDLAFDVLVSFEKVMTMEAHQ